MRIHAYASMPHYVDHLAPVWLALDPRLRGQFGTNADRRVRQRALNYGIDPAFGASPIPTGITIIAGAPDLIHAPRSVLLEHGAGQTYGIDHPSWAGGKKRGQVVLFVVPNEHTAATNRATYPEIPNLIAAPRVEWLRARYGRARSPARARDGVVVFSRRWDSLLSPELRAAWPDYRDAIGRICSDRDDVALHAHPRVLADQRRQAKRWNVPLLETFDEVAAVASVYVADNSSTIYEAAALDLPVVLLNSPHYRRTVHHGLRFWDCLPGPDIDDPLDLEEALDWAGEGWRLQRAVVTADVYPQIEGSAAKVAAVIGELL